MKGGGKGGVHVTTVSIFSYMVIFCAAFSIVRFGELENKQQRKTNSILHN